MADDVNAENDQKRWQALEAEARAIASTMSDPQSRRVMLSIAETYRRLAERAQFRQTHKK